MARRRGTSRRSAPPAPVAGDTRLTRRRFVALLAAGTTAALAAPALATGTRSTGKGPAAAAPAPSPKIAKGIDEQKRSTAKTLKTIRDFDLPPGSEQAFAYRPLPPRRRS